MLIVDALPKWQVDKYEQYLVDILRNIYTDEIFENLPDNKAKSYFEKVILLFKNSQKTDGIDPPFAPYVKSHIRINAVLYIIKQCPGWADTPDRTKFETPSLELHFHNRALAGHLSGHDVRLLNLYQIFANM